MIKYPSKSYVRMVETVGLLLVLALAFYIASYFIEAAPVVWISLVFSFAAFIDVLVSMDALGDHFYPLLFPSVVLVLFGALRLFPGEK